MEDRVTIDNIEYVVMLRKSPEDAERSGHLNIARTMRERNQRFHLYLKRPKGRRQYFAIEYEERPRYTRYSQPVSLGGSW